MVRWLLRLLRYALWYLPIFSSVAFMFSKAFNIDFLPSFSLLGSPELTASAASQSSCNTFPAFPESAGFTVFWWNFGFVPLAISAVEGFCWRHLPPVLLVLRNTLTSPMVPSHHTHQFSADRSRHRDSCRGSCGSACHPTPSQSPFSHAGSSPHGKEWIEHKQKQDCHTTWNRLSDIFCDIYVLCCQPNTAQMPSFNEHSPHKSYLKWDGFHEHLGTSESLEAWSTSFLHDLQFITFKWNSKWS